MAVMEKVEKLLLSGLKPHSTANSNLLPVIFMNVGAMCRFCHTLCVEMASAFLCNVLSQPHGKGGYNEAYPKAMPQPGGLRRMHPASSMRV